MAYCRRIREKGGESGMKMGLPKSDKLSVGQLSCLFDNMSESYKIFWFQAIVECVLDDKLQISYSELIDRMIASAWYMVTECKLNLGPLDNLEAAILYLFPRSGLKPGEKKSKILECLNHTEDKELNRYRNKLVENVPYRLLAPFLPDFKGAKWQNKERVRERANREERLLYYFDYSTGLKRKIIVHEDWADYLKTNGAIVQGWIEYHLIMYLQRRNPSVPGIPNKLEASQKRKLEKAKEYWKTVSKIQHVGDIYSGAAISAREISMDHFIPWSYVAHDELWNLIPTLLRVNSSKGNRLPRWDLYFQPLCRAEYQAYQMIWRYEPVRKAFEACKKEHLNNGSVAFKLYHQGLSSEEFAENLEPIVSPIYSAAKSMGYEEWVWNGQ